MPDFPKSGQKALCLPTLKEMMRWLREAQSASRNQRIKKGGGALGPTLEKLGMTHRPGEPPQAARFGALESPAENKQMLDKSRLFFYNQNNSFFIRQKRRKKEKKPYGNFA